MTILERAHIGLWLYVALLGGLWLFLRGAEPDNDEEDEDDPSDDPSDDPFDYLWRDEPLEGGSCEAAGRKACEEVRSGVHGHQPRVAAFGKPGKRGIEETSPGLPAIQAGERNGRCGD